MRVIAGAFKGRKIQTIEKNIDKGFRPTASKVREAIFNVLQFEIEGTRVCDLFAGSGALGIEALSRGASFALFIEKNKKAVEVIKENLTQLSVPAVRCQVWQGDVERVFRANLEKFDLVFMDPPYEDKVISVVLERLVGANILNDGAKIVVEHSNYTDLAKNVSENLKFIKEKSYGKTALSFFSYSEVAENG